MNILGISAYYHDSAACLVRDGKIIAAAQEERFSRIKHDNSFPENAIAYCLSEEDITPEQIDLIAFYDKPFLKFERILETYLQYAPLGIGSFLIAIPVWIKQKLWIKEQIGRLLNYRGKILFPEHHLSHAASAFFPSPYPEAAFLTIDGVGEWTTTSYGLGTGNKVEILSDIHFPHSLGLLYSAFTYYTGFKVNSGEYKMMGLAPYGEPKYKKAIYDHLVDIRDDGSFRLNMDYFNYGSGLTMTGKRFHDLFGAPPRKPESDIDQHYMDIARSIQEVIEEIILRMANHVHSKTNQSNLCLAGGVALNCVANGRILKENIFDNLWIQPAAGDAGGAVGAALLTWYQYLENPRSADCLTDQMNGAFLGPQYSHQTIEDFLCENNIVFDRITEDEIPFRVADLIDQQNVVGWFQGRMEFGPRALGSRSILGDARSPSMQQLINQKIKFRESFRPFAPAVLDRAAPDYFEMKHDSSYMLLTAEVHPHHHKQDSSSVHDHTGLDKLNVERSDIPAVTHVDYSARIQTVHKATNPLFYELLSVMNEKYDCPVIINTSFNVRGEPIVCSPEDGYNCFMHTDMDYLLIGNFLLNKNKQPPRDDLEGKPTPKIKEKPKPPGRKDLNKFGLTIGLVLIIIGLVQMFLDSGLYQYFLPVGAFLCFMGLYFPSILKPIYSVWMKISLLLGWIMTRLILTILFYLIVTPIGLIGRLFGKNFLELKTNKTDRSYWQSRSEERLDKVRMEKQF